MYPTIYNFSKQGSLSVSGIARYKRVLAFSCLVGIQIPNLVRLSNGLKFKSHLNTRPTRLEFRWQLEYHTGNWMVQPIICSDTTGMLIYWKSGIQMFQVSGTQIPTVLSTLIYLIPPITFPFSTLIWYPTQHASTLMLTLESRCLLVLGWGVLYSCTIFDILNICN